jgi:hypothetical protein
MPNLNQVLIEQHDGDGPLTPGSTPWDGLISGMMDARQLYGYAAHQGGYLPEGPVMTDISGAREINVASGGKTVGGFNLMHNALGVSNPMFWLLILGLILVGYLGFLFDVDIKKVGEARLKGGD